MQLTEWSDPIVHDPALFYFFKWPINSLIFLYFRSFNAVDSRQSFSIKIANDWICTTDLWYFKRRLCQLVANDEILSEQSGHPVTLPLIQTHLILGEYVEPV